MLKIMKTAMGQIKGHEKGHSLPLKKKKLNSGLCCVKFFYNVNSYLPNWTVSSLKAGNAGPISLVSTLKLGTCLLLQTIR